MSNVKIFAHNPEQGVIDQVNTLVNHPAFADAKVRIMPDTHQGIGCVIGFTADLGDKVIPSIIGMDLSCGMLTIPLGSDPIDYKKLNDVILANVPHGRNIHDSVQMSNDAIADLTCYRNLRDTRAIRRSLGTLGGGNHFISIETGIDGTKYLIIHTGSRNLGKQIAVHHQKIAIGLSRGEAELRENINHIITTYKEQGRRTEISDAIAALKRDFVNSEANIDPDLAYLVDNYRDDYINDMHIAANFAHNNRYRIAELILDGMGYESRADIPFETIHNYLGSDGIIRKGAISAQLGEKVLIPLNMRDGSLICIGKGNEDWNNSAPHGAGRLMSRNVARSTIKLDDFVESMKGIVSYTVGEGTLDEAPMAYKDPSDIIDYIDDTVSIVQNIKTAYNFKSFE